jgi:hypothetical protein
LKRGITYLTKNEDSLRAKLVGGGSKEKPMLFDFENVEKIEKTTKPKAKRLEAKATTPKASFAEKDMNMPKKRVVVKLCKWMRMTRMGCGNPIISVLP